MKRSTLGVIILLLVLGALLFTMGRVPTSEQIDATATHKANEIQLAIGATALADRANVPRLKSPNFDEAFPSPPIELQWEWTRKLTVNEVFDVRLGINGTQRVSIYRTRDTHFNLTRWLRYQNAGQYSWTVQVVTIGNDGQIKNTVSPEATPREFTVAMPINLTPTAGGPGPQVNGDYKVEIWGGVPFDEFGLNKTSAITFGEDKNLYLLTLDGDIFQMSFEEGNKRKVVAIYLDKTDEFQLAEGLAFHNGVMYIADAGRISTLVDSDGDGKLDKRTTISENFLTDTERFGYSNSALAFGSDNKLYVGISALTDHQSTTKPNEAAILQMDPDGSDQKVYATGLRDVDAMTFTANGELLAIDNPPMQLDGTLQYLPAGEINLIQEGKNYGFPYVFGDLVSREYLIDSSQSGEEPIVTFPATNLARGIAYHAVSDVLPVGIFVALSGTIPTAYYNSLPIDRMVIHVSLNQDNNGHLRGTWEPLVVFNNSNLGGYDQPVDVAIGPDGALYIATLNTGYIYRLAKSS